MKCKALFAIIVLAIALTGCDQPSVKSAGPEAALINKGFVDDNTYRVVCRGYPLGGLTGTQQQESSKRAALLHAYYIIQSVFNDSVAPDRDGRTEKIEYMRDHAVLYYAVHKKGLKRMVRKEPKPAAKQESAPEVKAETQNETKQETTPESKIEVK